MNPSEIEAHGAQQARIAEWRDGLIQAGEKLADSVAHYLHQDVGVNQLASSLHKYEDSRKAP